MCQVKYHLVVLPIIVETNNSSVIRYFAYWFGVEAGISEEEKRRLLHCVLVGGGPTEVEFSGELSDFIRRDVHQRYTHVKDYIHVTLIEVCFTAILVMQYKSFL